MLARPGFGCLGPASDRCEFVDSQYFFQKYRKYGIEAVSGVSLLRE